MNILINIVIWLVYILGVFYTIAITVDTPGMDIADIFVVVTGIVAGIGVWYNNNLWLIILVILPIIIALEIKISHKLSMQKYNQK